MHALALGTVRKCYHGIACRTVHCGVLGAAAAAGQQMHGSWPQTHPPIQVVLGVSAAVAACKRCWAACEAAARIARNVTAILTRPHRPVCLELVTDQLQLQV